MNRSGGSPEDFSEGIKALADRRLPNFQGR
jgi:hypothetical protein